MQQNHDRAVRMLTVMAVICLASAVWVGWPSLLAWLIVAPMMMILAEALDENGL